MENLTRKNNLRVIALTATAAPHIQKDIAKLLQIKKENIINIADSSGLRREEIDYKFIEYNIDDFDRWNRSIKFAKIIDEHIMDSIDSSEQGIAFFMKAGSEKDEEKDKYLKKINAYSTFNRIGNKQNTGLYTGKNKLIEYSKKQISTANFSDFIKLDYIIATKSFGMGVNLKRCDYVLLTEPPYSLEDLYQQSGRVGRMGQQSTVEILYHNRSLFNPLSKDSPYAFFLTVSDKRRGSQVKMMNRLVKLIFTQKDDFILNVQNFIGTNVAEEQDYLKWAIAHLITEFDLIDKYHVKYKQMFKLKEIGIYINKKINENQFLKKINSINKQLGMLGVETTI